MWEQSGDVLLSQSVRNHGPFQPSASKGPGPQPQDVQGLGLVQVRPQVCVCVSVWGGCVRARVPGHVSLGIMFGSLKPAKMRHQYRKRVALIEERL